MILFQNEIINRNEACIDIEDRGYQFGDGVYEVIRVYSGQLFQLKEHLTRLKRSAEKVYLELSFSINDVKKRLVQLVEVNKLNNGMVYLQITRGTAARTHFFPEKAKEVLTAYTIEKERPIENIKNGINAYLIEDIRWLRCDIKSLNLLPNVLAKQKVKELGYDEAIFHRDKIITEGSSSNLFIVKQNVIITHPANNLILNGITRQKVLDIAEKIKIPLIEREYTINELLHADEVFITSTAVEITPIKKINDKDLVNNPKSLTQVLQKEFEELITKI